MFKNRIRYPVYIIFNDLGEFKSLALPFFHVFTGRDQALFLSHVTKRSTWKSWRSFDVMPYFPTLPQQPVFSQAV